MKKAAINRNNIYMHLVEKQFNLLDKTIEDALLEPNWKSDWEITKEQSIKFEKYCIPLLKKVFKFNTNKAKSTYDWFRLQHGLKVK